VKWIELAEHFTWFLRFRRPSNDAPIFKDVEPDPTSGDDVPMILPHPFSLTALILLALYLTTPVTAAETAGMAMADADRLMLKVDGGDVPALYRNVQSARYDGGVILLHDQGANPDWPGVMQTLRRELPHFGWSTLAVELPALGATAQPSMQLLKTWAERVPARIDAAIAALGERNITNIVLIGHGMGASMAADYIGKKPATQIRGLIVIGMDGSMVADESLDGALLLRNATKPIYDIYGSRDLQQVVSSAARRAVSATAAQPGQQPSHRGAVDIAKDFNQQRARELTYRQHRIEGADHQFHGYEKQLLSRVVGWLRRYTVGLK
jgi:pimeloyl-ACP methyl ester carboxylesterase